MTRRYWIGVASCNHVQLGVKGGFCQVCHGKAQPLKRMSKNDVIIYYSSTKELGVKDRFQSFSAIGRLIDDDIYQFSMTETFSPYRRNVEFYTSITPVNIHSILYHLDFITDVQHYGQKFRYGLFEITKKDAMTIWKAMIHQ